MSSYGGIFEKGAREYTLDDFHYLQLDKLDRFVCLKPSDVIIPTDPVESSSDEDGDDDDGSDDSDTYSEGDDAAGPTPASPTKDFDDDEVERKAAPDVVVEDVPDKVYPVVPLRVTIF